MTNHLNQISLDTQWLGHSWHYFPNIESTNQWLKSQATSLPHGAVAITDFQSAGKGRLGRTWQAPPQTAILHSLFLRTDWPASQAPWLTMIAGLAAVRALRQTTSVPALLKWPNDIIVSHEGELRKLGGILLDGHFHENQLQYAIVGIGLNINLEAADLPSANTPPTSVLLETGQKTARPPIVNALLTQFEQFYTLAQQGKSPHTLWETYLANLHQPVTVTHIKQNKQLEGTAIGTNQWGNLLIEDQTGKIHEISAGDVTLRKKS